MCINWIQGGGGGYLLFYLKYMYHRCWSKDFSTHTEELLLLFLFYKAESQQLFEFLSQVQIAAEPPIQSLPAYLRALHGRW